MANDERHHVTAASPTRPRRWLRGIGVCAGMVLARKIVLGGGGSWGLVPMVPNEHVTLDEARAMAEWILALDQPDRHAAHFL